MDGSQNSRNIITLIPRSGRNYLRAPVEPELNAYVNINRQELAPHPGQIPLGAAVTVARTARRRVSQRARAA
jgi:hypothetical protein